jgi:hypothetical protein
VRRAALPLVYRASPVEKPMNFIDDTAVAGEKLGDYIEGLRDIFHATRPATRSSATRETATST